MELADHFERSVAGETEFPPTYSGRNLKEVAFPIGGVGTGHVSLGGRGDLRSWEIYNRPDRGNDQFYSFPAIRAAGTDGEPVARILEGPIQPPYRGRRVGSNESGGYMSGLPHVNSNTFAAAHPFAYLEFEDRELPCDVSLTAYNPTIPHDADASGIPAAVFEYEVANPTGEPLDVSLAFSANNAVGTENAVTERTDASAATAVRMFDPDLAADHPKKGSVCLGAFDPDATPVARWPGRTDQPMDWFDKPQTFWETFRDRGDFEPVARAEKSPRTTVDGDIYEDAFPATVCSRAELAPGERVTRTFVIAWRFPNRTPDRCGWAAPPGRGDEVIGNYYAEQYGDAVEAFHAIREDRDELRARSAAFVEAVVESSAPSAIREAALQNTATLCTNTCFRAADGSFHGFEGSHDEEGCCFGDCTHVWNYEQTTPFLFPELSRSLRETELLVNTDEEGRMSYRTLLPSDDGRIGEVAADGQMGSVLKLYRDWKLSGDTEWMRSLWPAARRALEFAWVDGGWDADEDGLMEGIQFNTYDVEFYGPNPLCQLWYLGALRAAERMARANDEPEFADRCRELYESGRELTERRLFNGEYFEQEIVPPEFEAAAEGLVGDLSYQLQTHPWTRSRPTDAVADGGDGDAVASGSDDDACCDATGAAEEDGAGSAQDESGDEHGDEAPRASPEDFQLGAGCLTDQALGQAVASLAGMDELVAEEKVGSALAAVHEHNFQESLRDHDGFGRIYALGDEAGTVVCSYPGESRPPAPFPYYSEVWTGSEYAAATAMIQHGMAEEAAEVVAAARGRFDGERRDPFDEVECAHHYARAMAAWGPLVAHSGLEFDLVEGRMSFDPAVGDGEYRTFWSTATAWGRYEQSRDEDGDLRATVEVIEGDLEDVAVRAAGVEEGNLQVRSG